MSLVLISGPSGAGPGERAEMLVAARDAVAEAGVEGSDLVRIDVPGRGVGEEGQGSLRSELEPAVPILQSGSLFGGPQALLLVDVHHLQAAEAEILAELIRHRDEDAVTVVLVSGGRLAAPIAAVVNDGGTTVKVAKMWEREAGRWVERAANERDLVLEKGAADALVQRFGTDTGSMNRALDQLREHRGKITSDLVLNRFKNRPEEPLFMFMDAIEKGRAGEALRRLGDFLTHNHPLVVVAALDNDLRRRSLAAAEGCCWRSLRYSSTPPGTCRR